MSDKDLNLPVSKEEGAIKRFGDLLENAAALTPAGMVDRLLGSQVRLSAKNFISQTAGSVTALFAGAAKGQEVTDSWDDAMNKMTHHKDGEYDFRMAKGWKLPEGVRYNGKLPGEKGYQGPKPDAEINEFFSIFHRNKQGGIEVLDKADPRYSMIVGPYLGTQIALAATIGTKGVTSLPKSLAAAEGVVAKVATTAYLGIASADVWGGAKSLYQHAEHSLSLKPKAVDRFAHLLDAPEKFTLQGVQGDLNIILDQYAAARGGASAQYYIPPLKTTQGTLSLLDQMSKGQVRGYVRNNPFSDIPQDAKLEDIKIGNIREVAGHPHFQKAFMKLADKALDGQKLNPSEHLALRFGMSVLFSQKDLTLMGHGKDQAQYTDDDYAQTLKALRGELSEPILRVKIKKTLADDKELSADQIDKRVDIAMNMWDVSGRKTLVADAELRADLKERLVQVNSDLAAKERKVNPIVQNRIDSPFGFN